jgi:hypothetical protein
VDRKALRSPGRCPARSSLGQYSLLCLRTPRFAPVVGWKWSGWLATRPYAKRFRINAAGIEGRLTAADRTHRLWLQALNAHARTVHAHEVTAALFQRMGDAPRAAVESRRADTERLAYADAAAKHPEWSADVAFTLARQHAVAVGDRELRLAPNDSRVRATAASPRARPGGRG